MRESRRALSHRVIFNPVKSNRFVPQRQSNAVIGYSPETAAANESLDTPNERGPGYGGIRYPRLLGGLARFPTALMAEQLFA